MIQVLCLSPYAKYSCNVRKIKIHRNINHASISNCFYFIKDFLINSYANELR
jgi:hypothetical protein